MKKVLLLLTSLTCMSLSAGQFEDICREKQIDEQYFQEHAKSLENSGTVLEQACLMDLMFTLNPHLSSLIPLANENNLYHEQTLRRLVQVYCRRMHCVTHEIPRYFVAFQQNEIAYAEFLTYAKEHLDELLPKEMSVPGRRIGDSCVTCKRQDLLLENPSTD